MYEYPWFGVQMGWRCPQCGRIYSPSTPMCFYCGNYGQTVFTDKTIDVTWSGTGAHDVPAEGYTTAPKVY